MRPKGIILLSVIASIGGVVFFLVCKYTYEFKVVELQQKAREAFAKALDQELENRNIESNISFNLKAGAVMPNVSDIVYWQDEKGRHEFLLDARKSHMNITNDGNIRALHSFAFEETPLLPDSLNVLWGEQLHELDISFKSALCISLMDKEGNVKSQKTSQNEWCNSSNVIFTFYVGYACEIEVIGFLYYSVWSMIYKELLLYILLFIILGSGLYKAFLFLRNKIHSLRSKEIVEVVKKEIVEVVKEVPVEVIKEVLIEKQVIKEVQRVDTTPLRSYMLDGNIIFYADQNIIEVDGFKQRIQSQSSFLLELFLEEKDNGYILKEDFIIDKLWPDNSGNDKRMHKAVARLRLLLKEIGSSFEIINKNDTYQLIISEKTSVL
jgi:hypothetical protein